MVVLFAALAVGCGSSPRPAPEVSACTAPGATPPAWQSTFADGFHDWSLSTFDQGGTAFVTTPEQAGLPPLPRCAGSHVVQFSVDAQQMRTGHVHAKLYKGWDVGGLVRTDEDGRPFARLNRGEEAGTYSTWFYIPRSYSMRGSGPIDLFQFKEDYVPARRQASAEFSSDVQSDLSIFNAATLRRWQLPGRPARSYDFGLRRDYPLLAVSLGDHPAVRPRPGHQRAAVPAPLGRWFNVTARLYPGRRVEYFVDGRLLDVWHADEYPVGIRYRNAVGWTFGIGHYGFNVGRLWGADASFTPLRRAPLSDAGAPASDRLAP